MAKQEKVVIAPQKGKQELAMNLKVDVLIYGGAAGSGKSRLLLMKPLPHIGDPDFQGVYFRRTTKALEKPGSLWPEARKLWKGFKARVRERDHQHVFKGGATLSMDHLEHVKDAAGNHQGTQYSFIGFDELTHFEQEQFVYLIGRLRSAADGDSFCMASTNPDPDSWVLDWVEWYLDDEGFPDPEKCGAIRHFLVVEDAPVFADTPEELAEEYPELCYQENTDTGEVIYIPPMTFSFIGGTIFDNPALIKANPKYLSALKAQGEVNRKRLLDGNWYARPEGSQKFHRSWLEKVTEVPKGATCARGWDTAASEPSDQYRYPDFTASTKMYRHGDYFYVVGDYHDDNRDDKIKVYGKFRKNSGTRNNLMMKQAHLDGEDCTIVLPQDSGAAGKDTFESNCAFFMSEGFIVKKDPKPNNNTKLIKYEPFSTACENGLVKILEHTFRDKATLEAWYKENEAFNGERSTSSRKDDWPDSAATVFSHLLKENSAKVVPRNQVACPTIAREFLQSHNPSSRGLPRLPTL